VSDDVRREALAKTIAPAPSVSSPRAGECLPGRSVRSSGRAV